MTNICLIKLGADGDVLRTLPLAQALKEHFPESEITWITKGDISELLVSLSYIKKIINTQAVHPPSFDESFDYLYNFDIDETACALALKIKAGKKYGFFYEAGYPQAFNKGAEYYLNTVFDDELKKTNRKTYQEMMFELAEIPYKPHRYSLSLDAEQALFQKNFTLENNLHGKVVGIHMGSSPRWPSKVWHHSRVKEFIKLISSRGFSIILFGGPREVREQKVLFDSLGMENSVDCVAIRQNSPDRDFGTKSNKINQNLCNEGIKICKNNPHNTKKEFAALIGLCDYVVCNDSLALHVSIGLGKKTIALFFVTSPEEVESYGLLEKIVSPKLKDFFPEKSDQYSEELVKSISAEEVAKHIL